MKQTENAAGCLAFGEYESGRHACLTSSASLHAANTHTGWQCCSPLLSRPLFCLLALTRRLHRVAFITTNTAPCYLFLRTPSSSHKLSLSFSSLYLPSAYANKNQPSSVRNAESRPLVHKQAFAVSQHFPFFFSHFCLFVAACHSLPLYLLSFCMLVRWKIIFPVAAGVTLAILGSRSSSRTTSSMCVLGVRACFFHSHHLHSVFNTLRDCNAKPSGEWFPVEDWW